MPSLGASWRRRRSARSRSRCCRRLWARPGIDDAFTVLSFGELGEPDMAYVEHQLGAANLEKGADIARAILVFDHLRSVALSPAESVALVERVTAQM
ncbi:MAG: Scr1 family TA system antitoxin-like transcriptional regulator [Pseudonocardia sp.]